MRDRERREAYKESEGEPFEAPPVRELIREPFEAPSAREKTIVSPRSTADSELRRLDSRKPLEAPISDK
ncbi:hypothetical protein TNCV_830631 [Trichonephila clavipes]|nr:hypothetical protein TNCV_830631 [Trichonephila clavipes]